MKCEVLAFYLGMAKPLVAFVMLFFLIHQSKADSVQPRVGGAGQAGTPGRPVSPWLAEKRGAGQGEPQNLNWNNHFSDHIRPMCFFVERNL